MGRFRALLAVLIFASWIVGVAGVTRAQGPWGGIFPEQRHLRIRSPGELPTARLPDIPPPPTVSQRAIDAPEELVSLDEAIGIGLANADVIRVLGGTTASSSGRTIYDPAIANTGIDRARARFDPTVQVFNNFNRQQTPRGFLDAGAPAGVRIFGDRTNDYDMQMGLSKTGTHGGTAALGAGVNNARTRLDGLPLNPRTRRSVELSYSQPLLQGGGRRANMAPIVIAQIDTERSFFQMKDSVQSMVRGVIDAYWALVFARTDAWARRQQVEQGEYAFGLAEARSRVGIGHIGDVAQSRVALANFRAGLVSSEANALQREAALRNILGLPPTNGGPLVPVTPPTTEQIPTEWAEIVALAEEYRPDLIELKLILEADRQSLLLARNVALPQVDATALYRWNGLEGTTPSQAIVSANVGDFTEWQLGVNFSVPLGLRQSRAELRQQELIIMRDRANLHQGLHNATHVLATSYRSLAEFYDEYRAFKEARAAATVNLDAQFVRYRSGLSEFINVLQAITSWGDAVSRESQALAQYNAELANLEQQTGTILEAHGVRFFEERYCSIGPAGRLFRERCYPRDSRPGANVEQYPTGTEPAENSFNLNAPLPR